MLRTDNQVQKDTELLRQYVSSWSCFSGSHELSDYEVPPALAIGTDEIGSTVWRPLEYLTEPSALVGLYTGLGLPGIGATRFPPLYEQLILSYRWTKVDLGQYQLLPNWPAPDLNPLLSAMLEHDGLRTTFQMNGYVQFAQGPDTNYDAICFDFRHRQKNGDCRIVQLDHEATLRNFRIQEKAQLATSFRELVIQTIDQAQKLKLRADYTD